MAIYGEFDYQMIRKYDLPIVQHIGKDGTLIEGPKNWIGKWFKKVDDDVLGDLQDRGILIEEKSYTHSYPFCYRCETPLIYNAVDSWFVDITKIKPQLMKAAETINWYPENIKEGRFKYILETAPDWSISRNRFWATAIPVWKCDKCGEIKVVGSVAELKQNAVEKLEGEVDLHKHVVDKIHLKCSCGEVMNRIPEVLDCWFESGSMPYAAKHYPFENQEWFKTNFPADFISEYIAQVRAWFYYMHVLSTLLFGKAPFKNVVVSGTILASDGTKMSKSKGNFPDPEKIFETYGADSLRLYLMASALMRAEDLNFFEENVKEMHRKVVMILANVKNFYELFSATEIDPNNDSSTNILDKWMISKTNNLVKNATKYYDDYNTINLCSEIITFVDDLSTWFVRRSRDRFKSDDVKEKNQAITTLAFTLTNLSKVMAPIAPFISEEVYQSLKKSCNGLKESVHLDDWPLFNEKLIDNDLEKTMLVVREVCSKALDERKKANIPIRQALGKLSFSGAKINLANELLDLIKDELNVKEVIQGELSDKDNLELVVTLDTTITPELLREGISRELIRKINDYRKELKLTIKNKINLIIETNDDTIKQSVNEFSSEIKKSVQAIEIVQNTCTSDKAKEVELNKAKIKLQINLVE